MYITHDDLQYQPQQLNDQFQQEYDVQISMSRASSNYSIIQLNRMCSITSSNQQDTLTRIHQKYYQTQTIFQKIQRQCNQLAELFQIQSDLVLILLNKYKWNTQKLKTFYFQHQFQQFSELNKKKQSYNYYSIIINPKNTIAQCPVCYENQPLLNNIQCNHTSCKNCWKSYLKHSITNVKGFTKCMFEQCHSLLLYSFVINLIPPDIKRKYIRNISTQYVKNSKSLSFCPAPDCDYCYEDTSLIAKNVVCLCGKKFCFKCGKQPHQPCSCFQVESWSKITKRQSINEAWIKKNTKICPTCKLAIERSIGCNFIICNCGQQFCYNCSKKWDQNHKSHFKCPFNAQIQVIDQKQMQQINLIISNYGNFLLYDGIQKKSQLQLKNIEKWRQDLCKRIVLNENQTCFINKAYDTLIRGNSVIKWVQVFNYFLKNNQKITIKTLNQFNSQNSLSQLKNDTDLNEFKLKNLKIEMEKYSYELQDFKKRIIDLVSQQRYFMQISRGVQKKQFFNLSQIMEKKIKNLDKMITQYLTYLSEIQN